MYCLILICLAESGRQWSNKNKVNPTQVRDQMPHPVSLSLFLSLSDSLLLALVSDYGLCGGLCGRNARPRVVGVHVADDSLSSEVGAKVRTFLVKIKEKYRVVHLVVYHSLLTSN